jgi:hypothetical protein
VPLPPLPEQRRIVAILDEAFEGIATAKANAEKNLQSARELFASRMQVLFGQDESWELVPLEELLARGWISSHLDGNHGSDYPRKEEFVDAGVPYIAASAIKGGTVDFAEAKYLSPQRAATIRKGLAKDRDVLFAHMNEAETRAEHIDPALKAAGWGVVEGSRVRASTRITPGPPAGQGQARPRPRSPTTCWSTATPSWR